MPFRPSRVSWVAVASPLEFQRKARQAEKKQSRILLYEPFAFWRGRSHTGLQPRSLAHSTLQFLQHLTSSLLYCGRERVGGNRDLFQHKLK